MSKRKLAILAGIFFCFIILLILFRSPPTYNLSPVQAKNISNAYYNDGLYFYTGHGFAKYNLANQKTEALNDFTSFPNILNVDINNRGAVYRSAESFPPDDLYCRLKALGLATGATYWWETDFKTGKTSLLGEAEGFPSEIVSAKQTDSSTVVARQVYDHDHSDEKRFELYRKDNGKLVRVADIKNRNSVEIVWANNEKALFSSKKSGESEVYLSFINFSDNSFNDLPAGIGGANLMVNKTGDTLVFQTTSLGESVDGSESVGLYKYEIGDKEPRLLLEDFVGNVNMDAAQQNFLVAGRDENNESFYATINPEGKLKKFNIDGKDLPNLLFLVAIDGEFKQIAAIDDQKNLYLLSSEKNSVAEGYKIPEEAREVSTSKYNIFYDESSSSFSILILENPYKENTSLALNKLRELGVDTNQHSITVSGIRTIDLSR